MAKATADTGWLAGISTEVRCLCVISFISAVGFGIQSPAIPVFGQALGVGSSMIGMIIAAFPLARLLMAWPGGRLLNRWGEYRVLCAGLGLMTLGSVGAGFSTSAEQLLALRGLCGVGSILYSVSAMSLMLRTTAASHRGRAAGLFMGAYYVGTVTGPAIGSLFVGMSVRLPFFIYGAGTGAAALVAALLLRHLRQAQRASNSDEQVPVSFPQALQRAAYRSAIASNFAIGFAVYGVRVSVLPLFLLTVLNQPAKWIGISLTIGALSQTLLLPKAGQWVDTWGRKPSLMLGLGLVLSSYLVIQGGHSLAAYLAGLALMGLGTAFCTTAAAAIAGDTANGRGGTVIAGYQMAADLGMVIGPVLIGVLAERYSYALALGCTTGLLVLAALTTLAMAHTKNPVHHP
ncbi:Predicted arabinose efflux permease, MFS family [Pseudomonas sp. ok272]|nr:Predicted arabinose efflux permease, MFS family [Pseudomonas sp. ok272]SFN25606.1 Predicted arabinose efflux permease, MFS family [Pseudomonas sp. ok602]